MGRREYPCVSPLPPPNLNSKNHNVHHRRLPFPASSSSSYRLNRLSHSRNKSPISVCPSFCSLFLFLFSYFSPSDPDIQHLPFFAISPAFFSSLWSSYYKRILHFDRFANFFTAIQHKLFYVVMAFARFNLYALSYRFLFKKAFDKKRARGGRWAYLLEIAGILFFWSWFGSLLYGCGSWSKALVYLLVSHAVTSPLHVQVTTRP